MDKNPCELCGACCAYFHVSFYWGETDVEQGGTVPIELTEITAPHLRGMLGTVKKPVRCIALSGEVGQETACQIYEHRPSPCSDFGLCWADNKVQFSPGQLERCNEARAFHNLASLTDH